MRACLFRRQGLQPVEEVEGFPRGQLVGAGLAQESLGGGFLWRGGFGEAVWTKDGDKWIVKTTSILADGSKVTATNVVSLLSADLISLQSKEQTVNGKAIPDTNESKMKRAM